MNPRDLFEILVREHAPMLLLYLRCAVREPTLVDDLFQETMLVAWQRLDAFDRTRPFGPWLRGIAARLILAQRRQSARSCTFADPQFLEHLEERCACVETQAGDTLDDKLERLRQCLDQLPEHYRQTVQRRYRDGLTGARLAEQLQTTLENVKKRLQRARARLLECLEQKLAWS